MNTPYQWTKQVASHWGGTRNGTVVHWPKGIKAKGEVRSQIQPRHRRRANDPRSGRNPRTALGERAGCSRRIEGVSMLYAFNDAKAAEGHETQYFEMFGNRGIYHQGWTAVTRHTYPWSRRKSLRRWTMTSGSSTTRTRTGASRRTSPRRCPTSFASCSASGSSRRRATTCLPIDDRLLERVNPDLAGRPRLVEGKTQVLFGGMGHLSENCVLSIKNKSHSITAEIVVPENGAEGVIIAQGANIGGWSLYAKGGKLKYCYNWGGFKPVMIEGATPIPAGDHQVRMEFAYAGGGLGKGGTVTLYTDGKKVGEGNVDATLTNVFSADDGCDVGEDTGAPVSPDYGPARQRIQRPGEGRTGSRSPRPRKAPTIWLILRRHILAWRWRDSTRHVGWRVRAAGRGAGTDGCREHVHFGRLAVRS